MRVRPGMRGAGVALAAAVGCAGGGPSVEAELGRLRQQSASLTQALADTRLAVERLEARVERIAASAPAGAPSPAAAPGGAGGPASAPPAAAPAARATDPAPASARPLQVVRIEAEAERDPETAGASDDGSPPIVLRVGPEGVLPADDASPAAPAARGRAAPGGAARADLARAVEQVSSGRSLEDALVALERLDRAHAGTDLAGEARYWSGVAHARLGAPARALEAFESLLRDHPQGARTPRALLGIAEARLALGQRAEGQASLEQLIDLFPASEAAQEALGRLSALSGGGRHP